MSNIPRAISVEIRDVTPIVEGIVDQNIKNTLLMAILDRIKETAPPPPKFGPIPATGYNRSRFRYTMVDGMGMRYTIVGDSGYAGFLEFGTRKMAARPYIAPSVEWGRKQLEQLPESAWQ